MAEVSKRIKTGGRAYLKLALLAALVLSGLFLVRLTPLAEYTTWEGISQAIGLLQGSVWAPVLFVMLYAGATALAIPGTILTLAGGALFGFFWGTVLNSIAANIGANLAFWVARFLGRGGIEQLFGSRLDKLDAATAKHGFQSLLMLRLVPLVPFNALNFGSGITALRWPTYALATVIGIFPGTVVYTMFADALLQGSQEASREALVRVAFSGGLLVLLSFLPKILKRFDMKIPGLTALLLVITASALTAQTHSGLMDHSAFTEVLERAVHPPLVDYDALKENRQALDDYLAEMAAIDPEAVAAASQSERLAFWLNAYNACMLRQVVDHYPIQKNTGLLARVRNTITDRPDNSVWQIPDVFSRVHCRVMGEDRSQDQIEHEIIRPMGDPRIHFAANCAAISCPPLQTWAFTAEHLDEQLDELVRGFVSDERYFRVETGDRSVLTLSKVLDWYGDDFGGTPGLREFFSRYTDGSVHDAVLSGDTRIEFFEYDWTLNDIGR
jgi:uncharacterized membrane protein YdjX (TVP38/TMEM64 family)